MTDPVSPIPPATPAATDPAVAMPVLRLLTTDDDLACVDDMCLPAGTRDHLDDPAIAASDRVTERAR